MGLLLAQPGQIGPLKLKNRIIMGPMGTNYGTVDGLTTPRDEMYYAERAKGGVAMIMTEAMQISERARNHRHSMCAFHDRFIPGLARLVDGIHRGGALAVGQLNHRGALLRRSVLNMEPIGPSPGVNPNTGDAVRALSVPEAKEIQQEFLQSAVRLWRAGYDGVELHAANGYLFQQFFTARINKRTDQYGGNLENRMRLLLETVRLIKDRLPDFPLFVRISATEYIPDGYSTGEAIALAQALEREGICALDLSGGSNEHPEISKFCIQPPSMPRRTLEPYAAPIKRALSIPVILAGRIIDPEDAEAVLEAGNADFISIGRGLIADAYWVRKATGEILTPIRKCISCNICFERLTREMDVSCVQNPLVGTEFETLELAEPQAARALTGEELNLVSPKRVLVLGAGVAGVEAARLLAANGHQVEIWERAAEPGGQLRLAMVPPHKQEVSSVLSYRMEQLADLGVPIRTGMTATAAALREIAPDLAIVATGSRPRIPQFFRGSSVPCIAAWDALKAPDRIADGAAVTIVGGGMVGVETAEVLVSKGCRVTIIEMLDAIAADMPRNNRTDITQRLLAAGVEALTNARVERVAETTLTISVGGETREMPIGDQLILAVGAEPDREVIPLLEEAGIPHVLVGDCNRPGDFLSALRDAWLTALSVDFSPVSRDPDQVYLGGHKA